MREKYLNTTSKLWSVSAVAVILVIWQAVCSFELVESFLLPSPVQVVKTLVTEFPALMGHASVTLAEAMIGLLIGILMGFAVAVLMDHYDALYNVMM